MLERTKETTHQGKYTYIEYARFADDLVILVDAYVPLLLAARQLARPPPIEKLRVAATDARPRQSQRDDLAVRPEE
jgi:RNA-directed DNA polymerase